MNKSQKQIPVQNWQGKDRLLIDTGDGQQPEYFLNLKKSLNFDRFGLSGIILTHWHPDHVGGVQEALRYLTANNGFLEQAGKKEECI